MEIVCPYHWRQIAALTLTQKQNLWLSWMQSALWQCECGHWRRGASFSECAFELVWLAQRCHSGACMPVELTLAAIFTAMNFNEQGAPSEAERVINRALERLSDGISLSAETIPEAVTADAEVTRCMEVLREPTRRVSFFTDYLNLPDIWSGRALSASVCH